MRTYFSFVIVFCLASFSPSDPNVDKDGKDVMKSHLQHTDIFKLYFQDSVYIPVYSDIYSEHRLKSIQLTSTLSIRSTSLKDTKYVNSIDYNDTDGTLVKSFINRTLILGPMQSMDYVIDKNDTSGGVGLIFWLLGELNQTLISYFKQL